MPAAYEEFTADELAHVLADSRAALRDGTVRPDKAQIIACATPMLT